MAVQNTGYYLLGMLIERVTARSYGEGSATAFFTPLGLKSTVYCDWPDHQASRPGVRGRPQSDPDECAAAQHGSAVRGRLALLDGGDLVAWQRALAAGRVVKPASYNAMITPEGAAIGAHYGYGLARDTVFAHRASCTTAALRVQLQRAILPDDSVSIVVLGNTNGPWSIEY